MTAIPVLLYHAVDEPHDPRFAEWAVAPELFDAHMSHLAERGYRSVTVRELEAALREGGRVDPRTVAVTFDDGFADVHTEAWPVLRRHGMTATVFIATAYVGGTSGWLRPLGEHRRPMMSWSQVAELADAGIECAAHGHRHLQLDTVGARAAQSDVAACRAALEGVVGRVDSFAYPHGYYTRRLQRDVRRAGFTSACAVRHALSGPHDDRYARARIVVRGGTGIDELERMLAGHGLRRGGSRTVRRAAWRSVRRLRSQEVRR